MIEWEQITNEEDIQTLKTYEMMLDYGTLVDHDVKQGQNQKRR